MWISDFIIPALLAVVTALCSYTVKVMTDTRKTNNANAKGTMLLLRREIIEDHQRFVVNGEPMQPFDFEDLNEIHDAYKALGGNGLTDKMFEELKRIQLKDEGRG